MGCRHQLILLTTWKRYKGGIQQKSAKTAEEHDRNVVSMCLNFNMKLYRLHEVQNLTISMEKAWYFLSDPKNLKIITPDYMGFEILVGDEKKMYP